MTIAELDKIFPNFIFACGCLMLFFFLNPWTTSALRQLQNPETLQRFQVHQKMAWVFVVIGGLWSLQNLFFS